MGESPEFYLIVGWIQPLEGQRIEKYTFKGGADSKSVTDSFIQKIPALSNEMSVDIVFDMKA